MKKQIKTPAIPTMYAGLEENKGTLAKQSLTIDKHGSIFRFSTPAEDHIIKEAVAHKFTNFDQFDDTIKPQEMREWHIKYFDNAEPPAKQSAIDTAVWVWLKLCRLATDRTSKPRDPTTGKKSKNAARNYYRCMFNGTPTPCPVRTPQALACLSILDSVLTDEIKDGNKIRLVSEATLKAAIYEHAPELKTKQDAWRIFQYYRPQLIAAKVITCD